MDLERALRDGPTYLKNAEDALGRNVTNPDLLYIWDNQVAAIDEFLANTEPHADESADLADLRGRMRDVKKQLEQKVMAFEAEQEGETVPEEPPAEELIEDFKGFAGEIIDMADSALGEQVKDVEKLPLYEDPRDLINGYLADSEPFKDQDPELKEIREEIRKRKVELDTRIRSVEEDWRARDIAAGA